MKALRHQSNADKAELLHSLFPELMQPFITNFKHAATYIIENEKEITRTWESQLITASEWMQLASCALEIIARYENELVSNNKRFGSKLFTGEIGLLSVHCLHGYAKIATAQFKQAVRLFYGPYSIMAKSE
jgi:hypothetical protein